MNIKIVIYALSLILTAFAFSGINFNNLFKKNHIIEARIFAMLVIIGISYLVGSFIIVCINLS